MLVFTTSFSDSAIFPIRIGQFTKISRNSNVVSNLDTPPKKRRKRTKKEEQTIRPREKAILATLQRELTPLSAGKVAHNLKRLVSPDKLAKKNPKLLSSFLKVVGKNNRIFKNVQKGCEYACGGKTELITCPSCKRFAYHPECLESMFQIRNMTMPDLDAKWECPHC